MFANLIANACDIKTIGNTFPHYANVIEALTPQQADMLINISKTDEPIIKIQVAAKDHRRILGVSADSSGSLENFYILEALNLTTTSIPLKNISLKIDEIYYNNEKTQKLYDFVESHYNQSSIKQLVRLSEGEEYEFIRGYITLTWFGAKFLKAVLPKNETIEATQPLETL